MALPQEFLELAAKVRNWGRWGNDDEIGTLNLITADVVKKAVATVREGKRFSLAIPLSQRGPQRGNIPGKFNPIRTMASVNMELSGDPDGPRSSDDVAFISLQGATHWDSLAHVSYEGHLYNGFPAQSVSWSGAGRCGIDKVRTLISRGVLLDVARSKGVDRLEGGYAITPDDLDAAEAHGGVDVEPGDVVLIRTGHLQYLKEGDTRAYADPIPGVGMACALWFRERDIAAVAADTVMLEVWPGERPDLIIPVHMLDLVDMGLTQGQNFDLEALAADCAEDGRYAFFLEASPEPFERGLGSPVNPVAVK
ncbi:MAG: cyclase family protein [Actinomycetota bacterium]